MEKTLSIMSESSRDEEGYSDTSVGVALDFICPLEDVGLTIVRLRAIEAEISKLYPPYQSTEIEPDVTYKKDGDCHMFYRATFGHICSKNASTVHNIASIASGYFAYKVAEEFSDIYEINKIKKIEFNLQSPKQIAQNVCNEQEESLLWYIGDNLYDVEVYGDEYVYDGDKEELLKLWEDEIFTLQAIPILEDECAGEFGFENPFDLKVPLKEWNPLKTGDESSKFISSCCKNIKYDEILDFFELYIKDKNNE